MPFTLRRGAATLDRGSKPNGSSRRCAAITSPSAITSRVGPSATMRPPSRMTARSHSCRAYGRSWVTMIVVTSRPSTISASSRRATGSRFDEGSSSTRTSGRIASTVAERDAPTLAEAEVVRRPIGGVSHPDRGQRLGRPGGQLVAAQPEVGRPEGDVVADRGHEQLIVGVLEDDADAPADLGQVGLLDGQPGDGDAPAAGHVDPVEGRARASSSRRRSARARRRRSPRSTVRSTPSRASVPSG